MSSARLRLRLVDFVHDKNYARRQLTPSQKAAYAAQYKPLAAEEAKERQREALARGNATMGRGDTDTMVAQTPQSSDQGKARDVAAKKFGVSSNYVSRAERVLKKDADVAEEVLRFAPSGSKLPVKKGTISLPDAERKLGLRCGAGVLCYAIADFWRTPISVRDRGKFSR